MDSLLSYYPTVVRLCEKLSFKELKSLSVVSKGWWELTEMFVINRTSLNMNKPRCPELLRLYKHARLTNINTIDSALAVLPDTIESIEIDEFYLGFNKLKRFKKLRSLKLCLDYQELPKRLPDPKDLQLGLTSLEISCDDRHLDFILGLLEANDSLSAFSLLFGVNNDEVYSSETLNEFLKNIHLPKLRSFSINGNSDGINPRPGLKEFFKKHEYLEKCHLNFLLINDEIIGILRKKSEYLEELSLQTCTFLTDASLHELRQMSKLKSLDIFRNDFSVKNLENLNLKELKCLEISIPEDLKIQSMLQSLSMDKISVLKLDALPCLDSSVLLFISENCPNLKELALDGNYISERVDEEKRIHFKKLEVLDFIRIHLTDKLISLIFIPKLKKINMEQSGVMSQGIKHLIKESPFLENLNLKYSSNLVDSDFTYIGENCKSLRELNLFNCKITLDKTLKILFFESSIETCKVSIRGNCKDIANWKPGFKASYLGVDWKGEMWNITNGARSLLVSKIER